MLLSRIDCHLESFTGNYPTGSGGTRFALTVALSGLEKILEFKIVIGTSSSRILLDLGKFVLLMI